MQNVYYSLGVKNLFCNLDAEQARFGMTNSQVGEYLGISRQLYEKKKKDGSFNRIQIVKLCKLFSCSFEYLFYTGEKVS